MATKLLNSYELWAGVFVVDSQTVIRNARVLVRQGRIAAIRPLRKRLPAPPAFDYRSRVLIPGLINAHTHLELSRTYLKRPPRRGLASWIQALLESQQASGSLTAATKAVREGVEASLRSGTTTVGEIESQGASYTVLRGSPLRALIYRELLGLDPMRAREISAQAMKSLKRKTTPRITLGISPHSPYSVSSELMDALSGQYRTRRFRIAIHLAESPAELDWLQRGRGELADMLGRLKKIPTGYKAARKSPLGFLDSFGLLGERTTIVHGNYLSQQEIETLSRRRMSVVFCPGSHGFFRYDPYPLGAMSKARVNIALGTDSLASNQSLSLFREMNLLRASFPRVQPAQALRMATWNGARALGLEDRIGDLWPGKQADFVVVNLPVTLKDAALFDRLTATQPRVSSVFIQGERVV